MHRKTENGYFLKSELSFSLASKNFEEDRHNLYIHELSSKDPFLICVESYSNFSKGNPFYVIDKGLHNYVGTKLSSIHSVLAKGYKHY